MSYTLSFEASVKVKLSDVKGLANHNFRDVLEKEYADGFEHKNKKIDKTKTKNNISFFYDSKQKQHVLSTSITQIKKSLDERLKDVKEPLRKDAVVVRSLILQLDPDWYKDKNEKEKVKSYQDMISWSTKKFNSNNIIGFSIHQDESNPHIHVFFTPVTKDGRLSQKDWFKDPKSLREMHDDFRNHMISKGYSISLERKPRRKHLSDDEYKAFKQMEEKMAELNKLENNLIQQQAKLDIENMSVTHLKAQIDILNKKAEENMAKTEKALEKANINSDDYSKFALRWMKAKGYDKPCLNDYVENIDSQYPNIKSKQSGLEFGM